jgi:hypothetical protein
VSSHEAGLGMAGAVIDPGPNGPITQGKQFAPCLTINGLTVCPTTTDNFGVLVLSIHVPDKSVPVAVEIGLGDSGTAARTILHSLQTTRH